MLVMLLMVIDILVVSQVWKVRGRLNKMKPWERYKELKPLTEEQKAKPSGDYSKGVPLAAITGTLEGLASGLESYANGYTLGGYDWLNRKLGRNPQDLRDKLQRRADESGLGGYNMAGQIASGLGGALRGLPKLTGMAGEVALGSKYWGLPAMGLSGSLDSLIQSSFDNDFSNAGDIAVDTLQGGAIGVGMGGLGNVALKPLARYTSSNAMTKGLKGGLKNVADNPQALKIANEAVRKNDDIAQLYLDNLLNAADDVNRDSSNLIRNSLARRIDVPSTLNKENLKYSQFMKEHGQDELLDFTPTKKQLEKYQAQSKFNPNEDYTRASATSALEKRADNLGVEIFNDINKVKDEQLNYILKNNPAPNTYSTWIRDVDDIKTFDEVLNDKDWIDTIEFDPDYTREMAEKALKDGKITVYSSNPIEKGNFATPSKMEALSYSSNGKVYSKEVPLQDMAWIDPTQGMYAPVNVGKGHLLKDSNRVKTVRTLENTIKNPDIKYSKGGKDYYTKKYNNLSSGKTFDFVITDENGKLFDKFNTDANYLKNKLAESVEDVSLQRPIIGDYGGEIHSPISPITSASVNNIANKNIVVNSKLPHISTLYEGLNPYQREALTDAINQGRKMTNSKLGSLDSINEAKKSLNDMITKSFREGENAKVMHLEGIKNRLDNTLGKGLKGRDRTFARAKRMEDAFEKGKKYNPNNLEQTEYMENFNPLEKNAFAQGLMKKVTHNPLTSKNLSKKALDYNNTFREVLPTSKYNELRRGLNKNSVFYERLANIGARAENKLRIPEGSRVFLREQLEETTPQKIGLPALGAMLDEALYRGHKKALNKAAINLLDPTFEGVKDAWLIENYPTLNAYISGALANE